MGHRICMLASELTPFAKSGGLADVAGALTKQLRSMGHDVRAFLPLYAGIDRARFAIQPIFGFDAVPLEFGGHRYLFALHRAQLPHSDASVYLIECPALFARERMYTADADEHLRFIAFTRAALECCQRLAFSPQIVHCNDWHTAFAPLLLRSAYAWDRLFATTRTVLTIHNIAYQGGFAADRARDVGIEGSMHLLHQDDLRAGYVNSLKHGILYADVVTTVSPTYAREILTAEAGYGLEAALRSRGADVVGILNGIDHDDWNPATDSFLPLHFDAQSLAAKTQLKYAFLTRLGLKFRPRTPLFGLVSRLTPQKGLDLLFETLPEFLEHWDACVVALGSGDALYEDFFTDLQKRFPGRVKFHAGFSDELAHWIEAASDFFLMPSRYEPCGLNQMYSLRYGTIPIVRRTGGLADSVEPFDAATKRGTGIVFDAFTPGAMRGALDAALDLYRSRNLWQSVQHNAMAQDFSWKQQAARYEALYTQLIEAA